MIEYFLLCFLVFLYLAKNKCFKFYTYLINTLADPILIVNNRYNNHVFNLKH